MKCQFCEQEATVIFTKIVGDKSQKTHLCAGCADEKGITNLDNFNISDMLMNDGQETPEVGRDTLSMGGECLQCGFTLDDLHNVGRLGCSACYEVFEQEVRNMIGNMHKGTQHIGKVPEGMLQAIEGKERVEDLELKLAKAIENEEYEKAGQYKEELLVLRKSLSEG